MKTDQEYEQKRQQDKQRQNMAYTVSYVYEDGRYAPFEQRPIQGVMFDKTNGVTLKRCQEFVSKINKQFGDVGLVRITLFMTQYDFDVDLDVYIGACFNDWGLPVIGKRKQAVYEIKTNTLTIYEDYMPVCENSNGVICKDEVALADSQ
ncbi:MAG: hypothetical protein BWK73_19175 [Thiothrix lacustris]|uniref:Uncharacterized protein n=1 Tax=Thiothrix lacustris TaxID=525917 RepID=A0A1Y1QPW6_9GAMM|nr:MAG: hypothetical protein BWK73_19175 [Thiothrix lacustris]